MQPQSLGFGPGAMGLLAPLQPLLNDNQISELLINRPQEVFYEKDGQLTAMDIPELTETHLKHLFQLMASENAQILNETHPLLSASLNDGSRIQCVLPPTAKHYTLSIRRKVVRHLSLEQYEKNAYFDEAKAFSTRGGLSSLPEEEQELAKCYHAHDWATFIRKAIELKKNIVISGGTSSGKTTFLNACLQHIPRDQRIIILEDTREIDISHPNQVQLLASKGGQSKAQVNMQDLVQCCLRLRPDRIICGEIRGKEILDFLAASSTGHEGSMTSLHANNPSIAFMRMTQMYKLNNVPSMSDDDIMRELKEVIDVIIQIGKTPRGRRVQSVYYKYGHLTKQ
ncbi:MAG: P-type DNA transfer ATPase VirB11 [Gammaproteobacteria bacterium]|nr:P-type DNA transfer ATPase VirB11 [Gammaproteobacteria bacterium]